MPTTIEARRTDLTTEEAARALRDAFTRIMGYAPGAETLSVLLAKCALETGRFKKIWGFNFGNVKAAADYAGFIQFFRCNEVIKGVVQWFDPPHVQCRFRAYGSAADGAEDYLRFLTSRKRYALAWGAALRGNPTEFVDELSRAGYMTANVGPYRSAVVSLEREFRGLCREILLEEPTLTEAVPVAEHSAFSDADFDDVMRQLDAVGLGIGAELRDGLADKSARDAAIRGKDFG